jgi:3-methylcrotonyl-CoA carboxylase alpha subunit
MTSFVFRSDPGQKYQAVKRVGAVIVNGCTQPLHSVDATHYVAQTAGRPSHVRVVADGDLLYLQLNGRSCVIERVDPTRSNANGAALAQGSASAPMPGVVVSWVAQAGAHVEAGQPLLVIESMKLQMTIEAPQNGVLEEMPFQPGQTFQRGAVLARVRTEENLK